MTPPRIGVVLERPTHSRAAVRAAGIAAAGAGPGVGRVLVAQQPELALAVIAVALRLPAHVAFLRALFAALDAWLWPVAAILGR